jgi:hypothetical protein
MRIILALLFSALALEAQVTDLRYSNPGVPGISTGDQLYTKTIRDNANTAAVSNAFKIVETNLASLTNVVAASAVTNATTYNVTLPAGLHWQAQNDAITYARQVLRYSSNTVNMFTNGQLAPLATALSLVYDSTIGFSNIADIVLMHEGATVSSGTNLPTLRGRILYGTNIALTTPGLYFQGTNATANLWHIPSSINHTIGLRMASETNANSGGNYQWAYSLISTNGYGTACYSSLGWNSAVFYQWVWTQSSGFPSYGVFPRYFGVNPSEGLMRGQRQFRNVISTVNEDSSTTTNISTWVDGICGQQNITNILSSTAANRLLLGSRSDGQYYFRGFQSQLWYITKNLTSNEIVILDRAMSIIAREIPVVVYGDSISFFDYTDPKQGREWSQQMWQELGVYTNLVVVHNHAKSGQRADQVGTDMPATLWHRRPYIGNKNGSHLMILSGINNIVINNDNAVTTFGYISNLWNIGISNGYTVHACTLLPLSTNYSGWNLNWSSNVMYVNNLIRGATNNPFRPFTYLWDFNQTVTDTNALTQLFDGIHPTNSVATAMGKMVGTNRNVWLVTP